jgi:pimeloyl-ACP methyl ester carboxylesterase
MRQIVLVHGAWGGAWIWRRVLPALRAAGHEVHAVTLTGDGERAHLRHPGIGLRTHIADVVGLVDAEELDDVSLVGHSYAGQVITGAADVLGSRVRQLVYVDAMVPLPGEGWGSNHAPQVVASRQALAALNDNALPPPDPADFGLAGVEREWLLRRQVPHPFGPYREAMPFDGDRWRALPRAFIDCTAPAYPTITGSRQRVREQGDWTVVSMPTGHCPMVSMPAEFSAVLLGLLK